MLAHRIGARNASPFFTGATSISANTQPFTVQLGGRPYIIDTREYRHSSQETLRDGVVASSEPDDSLFNANGAWARYRYDWRYGAGQANVDFSKTSMAQRFQSSIGVDPWTEGQLSLLKATARTKTLTTTGNRLCVGNNLLYMSDGTNLWYTADGTTWVAATAPGGTINSMTSDGYAIYVATSTTIQKYVPTAAGTPVSMGVAANNYLLVAFVANRLLTAVGNVLSDVTSAGSLTAIITHFQTTFAWTSVFAVGSKIYVGGYAGQRSEVYVLQATAGGSIVGGPEVAPLPAGELLNAAGSYAGLVVLATNKGVRVASIGGDGTLTYGPLFTAFGDTRCIAFDGRFAWAGWTNHPSGGRGLARMALDTTISTLQPAYASDLYEDTQVSSVVSACARFNGLTVFVVDGVGAYTETASYLTTGTLATGHAYFGTVERKSVTNLQVGSNPLVAGQSIAAAIADERGVTIGGNTLIGAGSTELSVTLDGILVRYSDITLTLNGDGSSSPIVRFWRLRCYPVPPVSVQWIVPLIIQSLVTVGGGEGQQLSMDVLAEAQQIRTWHTTKQAITYQEGANAYRVRVDAFELKPAKWNDAGQFFEHTMVVRLVSA